MNFVKCLMFGLLFFNGSTFALASNSTVEDRTVVDKLNNLALNNNPPIVFERKQSEGSIDSLYFAGQSYQGKPTRIFAYYATPKGEGPFPAIVLVHGGGGSAYKAWIKKWNEAGFAAISLAVEGQTGTQINKRPPNKWQKHDFSGPSRPGIYSDDDKPITDQWMYHASSAVIKAHNLLRSFDEINKAQIGLSGISWGGVITSTVMGFDQRFAFTIPIYGSGFLAEMENQYRQALHDNAIYKEIWEPALRITKFKNPTFWLTGLKETHFSLDAQANTYKLLSGKQVRSIQPDLKHNHVAGWTPKEPYEFARAVINGQPLPSFSQQKLSNDSISIKVKDVNKLNTATLYYTNNVGHTLKRTWQQVSTKVESDTNQLKLTAKLPETATAWLFNIEINGLIYSSELSERAKNSSSQFK